MRPVVGVSCAWTVETYGDTIGEGGQMYAANTYLLPIQKSGGVAVLIPVATAGDVDAAIEETVDRIDGLLMSGGGNISRLERETEESRKELPPLRSQQPVRHDFEIQLIKVAMKRGLPIIGMCRGHQTIAVALGGDLLPVTVEGHRQDAPQSEPWHEVTIEPGSKLGMICGESPWLVTSFHRQVVEKAPPGCRVSARSPEGYIEAIEAVDYGFLFGLQFHPEFLFDTDGRSRRLFGAFVDACRETRR